MFLFLVLNSCDHKLDFDKKRWCSESALEIYEERNRMMDDLMENHNLNGMTIDEVQTFFGCIDYLDTINKPFNIQYTVFMDYGWDIDPVHTKTLKIYLNSDFKVQSMKVLEWKK